MRAAINTCVCLVVSVSFLTVVLIFGSMPGGEFLWSFGWQELPSSGHGFIAVLIGLSLWAGGAWLGLQQYRTCRKCKKLSKTMSQLPTTPISELNPGVVKIRGILEAKQEPLFSPIQSIPCLYFRTDVEKQTGSGENSRTISLASISDQIKGMLVDEAGNCIEVDPAMYDSDLRYAYAEITRKNDALVARVAGLCGKEVVSGFFGNRVLAFEQSLECNKPYLAMGEAISTAEGGFWLRPIQQSSWLDPKVYLLTSMTDQEVRTQIRNEWNRSFALVLALALLIAMTPLGVLPLLLASAIALMFILCNWNPSKEIRLGSELKAAPLIVANQRGQQERGRDIAHTDARANVCSPNEESCQFCASARETGHAIFCELHQMQVQRTDACRDFRQMALKREL